MHIILQNVMEKEPRKEVWVNDKEVYVWIDYSEHSMKCIIQIDYFREFTNREVLEILEKAHLSNLSWKFKFDRITTTIQYCDNNEMLEHLQKIIGYLTNN